MAVVATHVSTYEGPDSRSITDAIRRAARHVPIVVVLALVAGIHASTLHYYFFGDDFLVPGDIATRSFGQYMRDVVMLDDLTPNWRPLTMFVYWLEFQAFGFDTFWWRLVNLGFHMATVALLYALVFSLTNRVFVATGAALIFGVSASAVHTVTYITAFPHVLSEFLLIASLYSLHRYVAGDEKRAAWYWGAFVLYVGGFLANEGGVVIGAVLLTYYATSSLVRRKDPLDFALKVTPFGLAAAVLVGALAGCGCQGVDDGFYSVGWHIPRETWVYMSRLAYPVGAIPKDPSALEWAVGSVVAGAAIFFLIRGPNIARFAAVGMVIGLMPYVPGKIWTATRYTYMALPFFGILVAVAAGFVHGHLVRAWRPAAHVLAAAALIAVGGLYSWQTIHQTQPFLEETDRWELLADDLRANYQTVPAGTTVYIVDDEEMWSNLYWQPTWLASVGRALYGEGVSVRAMPSADLVRLQESLDGEMLLLELRNGHLRPTSLTAVKHRVEQG
jgi:hypothetical protein